MDSNMFFVDGTAKKTGNVLWHRFLGMHVQTVSVDHLALQDLFDSDVEVELMTHETPPGKIFTISFLVTMLQWLSNCADETDDDLVVYPICFEEIAVCLAHQSQFCFPFWNASTGCMDKAPLCARFQKPTLSWILRVVRAAFAFLGLEFGRFGDVFFTNITRFRLAFTALGSVYMPE